MGKRITFFISILGTIYLSAYARSVNDSMVKDLKETVVFNNPASLSQRTSLASGAQWYIQYFQQARKEKLARIQSLFQIDSIRAILEWGGGLEKKYNLVLFTNDAICWISWGRNHEAFGKVAIDNKNLNRSITQKIDLLSRYNGGEELAYTHDRTVLFMTFYQNNAPYKTFYADFPDRVLISRSPYYGELDALLKTITELIGSSVKEVSRS